MIVKGAVFQLDTTIALEDVKEVRKLVERIHLRLGSSRDDAARVAMAAHELLENAIKFSLDGTSHLRIEVSAGAIVTITTRNRAAADHRADLAQIAAELAAAEDPMMFYVGLMAKAPQKQGGLGIGRIAAEGDMAIGFTFTDDIVEVHASSAIA